MSALNLINNNLTAILVNEFINIAKEVVLFFENVSNIHHSKKKNVSNPDVDLFLAEAGFILLLYSPAITLNI